NEQTAVPVPFVYAFDDSHTLVPRDYILMNCLPGRPLSEMPQVDCDGVLRQVGQMLAEVHALHNEHYGYLGDHRPMVPQNTWVEAFEVMWHKLLDDVVMVGYYNTAERQFLADLFKQHRPLFDRPVPASLLHMDVWHENILVDERGVVSGLIDWDRAVWGDPEIEFAILDYCRLSGPAFWEGYGQPRDTSAEAQIRQHFYLLYELQKYIVIYHGRNHEPEAAATYKQQVLQLVKQAFS
ncbi:MAG: aminoglycoside phosphotransferase family protein, partial [Anaerolineales bacterium]|nr:aminoglycoside phosphotransferase family protein [Anaerolineales bacterium]